MSSGCTDGSARSRQPNWGGSTRRSACTSPSESLLGGLGGGLDLLLVRADLGEGVGVDDVGDGLVRAGRAVVSGCRTPSLGRDAVLLAEQGHHDLRLLLAETGQLADALQQLFAVSST